MRGGPTGNEKKAAAAIAPTLLGIAWAVMRHHGDYPHAGAGHYQRRDHRNRDHLARHHQHAPARPGYQLTRTPPGDHRPPPGTDPPTPASSQPARPSLRRRTHKSRLRRRCRAPAGVPKFHHRTPRAPAARRREAARAGG